ncbi:MAG: hypothetical protein LBH05_02455 [Deferribacteraceae bacterium]|jgi:hypothetical protein|nr:hypothetical protein [Deferribacteraceae bacterium]
MTEFELLGMFAKTPVIFVGVMAQGFIIGLAILLFLYKLSGRFLDNQSRQITAFEEIAHGVQILKEQVARTDNFATECRITMQSIDSKIERLSDKVSLIMEKKQ